MSIDTKSSGNQKKSGPLTKLLPAALVKPQREKNSSESASIISSSSSNSGLSIPITSTPSSILGEMLIDDALYRLTNDPIVGTNLAAVRKALQYSIIDDDLVLVDAHNYNVTARELRCLSGSNWLNDQVINFMLKLFQQHQYLQRLNSDGELNSGVYECYFSNTYLFDRLLKSKDHNINSYSYEDVRRWTQRTNIFDKRFVFFPYNIVNVHWSLMYADMPNKVIFLNDSLMWENKKYLKVLWRYLCDESFDKRKIRLDAKEWRFVYNKNIQKQENGFDCGVFVLAMIHCIYTTGGLNRFSFHQSQMPSMRLLYCHYCLQAKF
jgi:sentrin-specific protease 1